MLRRGVAATLQIGFQITLSHSLDARVIMTGAPAVGRGFVFQCPVLLRAVVSLANIEQGYELLAIPGDAETNCVSYTRAGKAVALPGITEIAELSKVIIVRSEALMARSGAMPLPTIAQRQACAVLPGNSSKSFGRHKKWTSHWLSWKIIAIVLDGCS
jgi:hypothetical protein